MSEVHKTSILMEPRGLSPWPSAAHATRRIPEPDCGPTSRAHGFIARLAATAIRAYQRWVSPYKGFVCAHRHLHQGYSCSEFARRAVLDRGVVAALPEIWNQFRGCREAVRILRQQRRAVLRMAASAEDGIDGSDDSDAEEHTIEERTIDDRFYEESERKRKRLEELPGSETTFTHCSDWSFMCCTPW